MGWVGKEAQGGQGASQNGCQGSSGAMFIPRIAGVNPAHLI